MLLRYITRPFKLFVRQRYTFSGGHDDHHDHHHDYSVHIDKSATWIKYKSVKTTIKIGSKINLHWWSLRNTLSVATFGW